MTSTAERPSILDQNGDLPDDVLLGRIVLFTITDVPTKRDRLETWFDELGLDKALLPAEIKPIDAFRKATAEAKEKYVMPNGATAVVLCRDVDSKPGYLKRQITREVRDTKEQQLSYSKAIDCTFFRGIKKPVAGGGKVTDRGSERVQIKVNRKQLDNEELAAVRAIAEGIQTRFLHYYDHLDGNRLRATVRDYVKHLNAIEIKAGCYFVHASRSAELRALETLVQRIGGGCFMHTIPLVDVEEQRRMVTNAYEREAAEALADVTREARELAATGSVTGAAYARVKAAYDDVVAKATEHMATLQISQDITGASAQVALDALLEAQKKVTA